MIGDETKDSLTLIDSPLSVMAIRAIQELKADGDRKKQQIGGLGTETADLSARLECPAKALDSQSRGKESSQFLESWPNDKPPSRKTRGFS